MIDLIAEFNTMPRNPRWYAEYWLRYGERHPAEHFKVSEQLDRWCPMVEAAAGLRERLLAELPPEGNA